MVLAFQKWKVHGTWFLFGLWSLICIHVGSTLLLAYYIVQDILKNTLCSLIRFEIFFTFCTILNKFFYQFISPRYIIFFFKTHQSHVTLLLWNCSEKMSWAVNVGILVDQTMYILVLWFLVIIALLWIDRFPERCCQTPLLGSGVKRAIQPSIWAIATTRILIRSRFLCAQIWPEPSVLEMNGQIGRWTPLPNTPHISKDFEIPRRKKQGCWKLKSDFQK